jgi:hypothetical protein
MGLSKSDSDTLWQAVQDRKFYCHPLPPYSPPLLSSSFPTNITSTKEITMLIDNANA